MTATQSREVLMAPLNMFVISIAIISIAPLSCVCLLYWLYCNVELSDVLISCCQYVKLYRGIQTISWYTNFTCIAQTYDCQDNATDKSIISGPTQYHTRSKCESLLPPCNVASH